MSLYIYDGPVYGRDGRKIESRRIEYTNANSESEARRNIQYKIGKDKDIIYGNVRLHITDHEELEPSKYCSDCGNLLNDAGRCPLCQEFEYSILDDIKLLADIDDDVE